MCIIFLRFLFLSSLRTIKTGHSKTVSLETILEWELALVKDGQLVRNDNVGIVFVIFM